MQKIRNCHVILRLEIFLLFQVQSDEDKAIVEKTKLEIQNEFAEETGLLVDVVLQGKYALNRFIIQNIKK